MSTNEHEGPLSRLMRGLGLDADLAPIAAVKRIEERPVSLTPELLFKMAPTPELMSDTGIHRLAEIDLRSRTYDLEVRYNPSAPAHERFTCIDLNSYDGAPDAEAPCTFIGRGASEKEARMALLDQFSAFDGEEPRPRPPTRTVFSSPFEPPEVVDDRHIDFDDGLTDDDR